MRDGMQTEKMKKEEEIIVHHVGPARLEIISTKNKQFILELALALVESCKFR